MIDKNIVVSFSGGETSAYMARWLKENQKKYCDNLIFVFANTGQEHKLTLEFVDMCDKQFDLDLKWVEAKVYHGERISTGYKLVNYESANLTGEPYEEVIKKYGIPNQTSKHCTRDLKANPITNYCIDLFGKNNFTTAIGIRVDEMDRLTKYKNRKVWYPLATVHKMTKQDINVWWSKQNFRLKIPHYQGNCTWCWKKSMRKLLTVMDETPEAFDFPERMEQLYGTAGPEFDINRTRRAEVSKEPRRFFRNKLTVNDLKELLAKQKADGTYVKADDLSLDFNAQGRLFDELDVGLGCEESCEVFADEEVEI